MGGVEELCRQLAHAYQEAGHGVIVITNQWPPTLPEYEEFERIPVYRLPMRVPEGGWRAWVKFLLTHRSLRSRFLGLLRHHNIDLMHVQCVSCNGYYALMAQRELRLPLVVTAHGERTMDAGRLYQRSPLANRVLRRLLIEAEAITACSRDTLNDLEHYFGSSLGNRAGVVYNGIRLYDFQGATPYSNPRPYVLAVGRLVPQKGFDVLIRAFAEARLDTHDLLIAGEGAEQPKLDDLIRELGVTERVKLLGRAERPKAVSLFAGCAFFILPSRLEPFGIVSLEAMACGKAVVASNVGGVPEVIADNVTGLLVPAENPQVLAAAIKRLANDLDLQRRLGAAGRARAEGADWAAVASEYLTLYRRLLAQHSVPKLARPLVN
jgi:glycogen(starch) synthase